MTDRPVFIAGLDRAGKTPMRIAVERSASIALARRAELWTHHHARHGDLADDTVASRAVAAILRDRHVADQVHDGARLERELLDGPRTYAHFFALIGRQHAEQAGRARWGDQTALIERSASEILDAFPHACFVHMIRDPRDRFAASLTGGGIGRGGASAACEAWLESVSLAEMHTAAHPDRYLVVRFEDLAHDPRSTLDQVLAFIGEPLLAPDAAVPVSGKLAAGVGMYADLLPARAVALIESRCGTTMLRHRYVPDEPALGRFDRLRLTLLDRPLGTATQLALRAAGGARRATRATRSGGA